ncbi:MAG: hypothetical protein R2748_24185 [Bryobacterales bacterium]
MGKPIKVSWSVSRLENSDVSGGVATVSFTPDGDGQGATLGTSASLNRFIRPASQAFRPCCGRPRRHRPASLMTPDEAGQTIGGTIHVYLAGKNLAKPLAVSLQQTATEEEDSGTEPDPEEEGGSSGGNSGFIQWSG